MNRVNTMVLDVKNKTTAVKEAVSKKLTQKKMGGAGTIAALIMIVIVVGILITFREEIIGWVTQLTGKVDTAITEFDPSPAP